MSLVAGVKIREAAPGEALALARLHSAVVAYAYQSIFPVESTKPAPESLEASWSALLDDTTVSVLVAEAGHDLLGSVVVAPDDVVPSGLLLKRLHVDTAWWGRGVGGSLHDTALDVVRKRGADRINLWVLEHNGRARVMYARRGWRLVPGRTLANDVPSIVDVLYEKRLEEKK